MKLLRSPRSIRWVWSVTAFGVCVCVCPPLHAPTCYVCIPFFGARLGDRRNYGKWKHNLRKNKIKLYNIRREQIYKLMLFSSWVELNTTYAIRRPVSLFIFVFSFILYFVICLNLFYHFFFLLCSSNSCLTDLFPSWCHDRFYPLLSSYLH